jgi:hypothetical protein
MLMVRCFVDDFPVKMAKRENLQGFDVSRLEGERPKVVGPGGAAFRIYT